MGVQQVSLELQVTHLSPPLISAAAVMSHSMGARPHLSLTASHLRQVPSFF